jgi:hypothetical protein
MEEYHGTITKEKLIESIKGEEVWTPKAEFGSAFHLVLENGSDQYWNESAQKYIIQDKDMPAPVICEPSEVEMADNFHKQYGRYMTWETWHTETIKVDHHEVIFRMRIDGMLGNQVHENKTRAGKFEPDFYYRSLQWRTYLMSMSTPMVQYNVFTYKEPAPMKEGQTKRRAGAREIREDFVHNVVKFYHGGEPMENEVRHWTRGLINFCERNNLIRYILPKEEVPK